MIGLKDEAEDIVWKVSKGEIDMFTRRREIASIAALEGHDVEMICHKKKFIRYEE